jgi:type I restriction enzyme S subunit
VKRGEVGCHQIAAQSHAPALKQFLEKLWENPATSKLLGYYVELNPKVDCSKLEQESIVGFIPMDSVEDGASGVFNVTARPFGEVNKGYTVFENGDILMAKITPCMENGKICIVDSLPSEIGFGSTEFHVIRTKHQRIVPRFVLEFLGQEIVRKLAVYSFTGSSGHQRVSASFLSKLPFPEFEESEQNKLVAAMNAARAKRRAKLAEADALLAGLDDFLLSTLGLTPPPKDERKVFAVTQGRLKHEGRVDPGYHHPRFSKLIAAFASSQIPKVCLGVLSPELVGGATPTRGSSEFYAKTGVKFLRILNVKANEFDLTELNFIKQEVHEGELKRSQLAANDILMTITGRVGNAAVVTEDLLPANINQHIVRLRLCDTLVTPEFLAIWLNSSIGLAISNRGVTGGTRIALDYSTIRALQIPVPSDGVQQTIAAEARRRREEARRLRAEAEAGWQAAKCWFEEQLLGAEKS